MIDRSFNVSIGNCLFLRNSSPFNSYDGGAIFLSNSNGTITNSTFIGNYAGTFFYVACKKFAEDAGGAIRIHWGSYSITPKISQWNIRDSTFFNNTASVGAVAITSK